VIGVSIMVFVVMRILPGDPLVATRSYLVETTGCECYDRTALPLRS